MKKLLLVTLLLLTGTIYAFSKPDSLIFNNGNYIVGEVKSMNRNIVKIKTDYSGEDFKIEWDGIKEIYTKTFFLITLTNGSRYNGHINTSEPGKITVNTDDGKKVEFDHMEIVLLDDIDQGFWSQVYASIDFGLDVTKANNFRQFSMRSNVGYIAKRWQIDAAFNSLNSAQDNVDKIQRRDGGLTYKYFLPHDWYPLIAVEFLSNTEQQLDLRTSLRTGLGNYIIHTNQVYWGFSTGANYNNENYINSEDLTNSIPNRKSWEGFFGTELNFFNVGDLSLLTNATAYPSFTESGRWRFDFKFDAKYDLPLDFYIKLGYTLNYDNHPTADAPNSDYIIHTGFGWEW